MGKSRNGFEGNLSTELANNRDEEGLVGGIREAGPPPEWSSVFVTFSRTADKHKKMHTV